MVQLEQPLFVLQERDDYQLVLAKQRASVLWLLSKAYMPKVPPELHEPCYRDHEGNDRLKPQVVHALANAELYCRALANIYADPNFHNLNHHGVLQVLSRKGVDLAEPMDATLTETVLVQTAPLRMNAHMAVIEGIMSLFIKEVLIPEKVMEVVSRFSKVNPESELPYDSEEAAILWVNKCCEKLRQKIERELDPDHSPGSSPDSSQHHRGNFAFIAPAQDLGDLSDGCCLSALISLYCPRHFDWRDIRLAEPLSLADSLHNLGRARAFCRDRLPSDVWLLALEDVLYAHPSTATNLLAMVADLLYLFEIRPPKCVVRPGTKDQEELNYINGQRQSDFQNYRNKNFQKASSPISDTRENYEVTRSGSWQAPQRSMSSRKIFPYDERKVDGNNSLRRTHSVNFSEANRRPELSIPQSNNQRFHPQEEDEEVASYFAARRSLSKQSLLEQEDNRRQSRQHRDTGNHQQQPEATTPGHLESLSENNEFSSGGKWAEPREQSTRSGGLQKSPSSYEIHQLSPSKQNAPIGRGYSCKRSQSELQLSQDSGMVNRAADNDNHLYQVQSVSHEHFQPRTFTREPRRSRNSYHEAMHTANFETGSPTPPTPPTRRFSQDYGRGVTATELESQTRPPLSGSLTWRKPKDLFTPSEWNKENVDVDRNTEAAPEDTGSVVSFANLASKQRNSSGSAINVTYMHQDSRDVDQRTFKKPMRPGYLNINKSHSSSGEGASPTSSYNLEDTDASVIAQMHDIRMKLEEKRNRIEQEKALLESLRKNQREKMGKAAFLQAVKGAGDTSHYSRSRQFSVEDISEDLDAVRRKWLEQKNTSDNSEYDNDIQGEEIQQSIEQLNSSLSDLQTDISRLTEQQEVIQKLLKNNKHPQGYFLHEQGQPANNKWAEPSNSFQNNSMHAPNMMMPDMPPQVGGRGHWGQPVIPFGGYPQQPPPQNNIPMWQQQAQMRPPSVDPNMMYGPVPFNHGFPIQNNFSYYQPNNPYYPDTNNSNQQFGYNTYNQTSYPVMQNTFSRSASQSGFHLHRNPSQTTFHPDEADNFRASPDVPFDVHRSDSRHTFTRESRSPLTISTDEFGRHNRNSELQHSPPSKPVLGKTFRVPKKVPSPSSPNFKQQQSFTISTSHEREGENADPKSAEDNGNEEPLNEKGFYISFEKEPCKPKPKLKPKHLKARNQQKKVDSEARKFDNGSNFSSNIDNIGTEFQRKQWHRNSELEPRKEQNDNMSETSEQSSGSSNLTPRPPAAPGVGFVVGSSPKEIDPDIELEMTRRKEMIMMMSLRRRAEQEKKKNQMQQDLLFKQEEERMKREQAEKKKEEERLRRQLILEQYRQKKAAEEEDGGPGRGREDGSAGGRTVTRHAKSRSASVTRPGKRGLQTSGSRGQNMSSPSSLDSPVGKGSQYNLSGGYPDEVSSEHGYAPSPCRSRSYPHSSPLSPASSAFLPGGLLHSRSTPSDGFSDSGSTISSTWAAEYSGPKLFVKPSAKSNKGIVINAVNTVLAGAVNSDTKRKVLEEIERSEGKHFLILFRDAGCQFRALYSYNPETEDVFKLFGIGPKCITDKMFDRFYKYNSGGKSFTQIHTKHLTATIDAFTIQNSLWQGKRANAMAPKRTDFC